MWAVSPHLGDELTNFTYIGKDVKYLTDILAIVKQLMEIRPLFGLKQW